MQYVINTNARLFSLNTLGQEEQNRSLRKAQDSKEVPYNREKTLLSPTEIFRNSVLKYDAQTMNNYYHGHNLTANRKHDLAFYYHRTTLLS